MEYEAKLASEQEKWEARRKEQEAAVREADRKAAVSGALGTGFWGRLCMHKGRQREACSQALRMEQEAAAGSYWWCGTRTKPIPDTG